MEIVDLSQSPDCIPILAKWHHAEWSYLDPEISFDKRMETMQEYFSDQIIPRTFICKGDDGLIGSAALVAHDMDTHLELSPWLANVYVSEGYRRQGVGSILVKHVMNYALATGFSDLYLFTPNQSAFYQAIGWHQLSAKSYHGQQVTVMHLKLSG